MSTDTDVPAYPAHWEADVVLRDGSTMRIRPIRPDDADALQRFHVRQSPRSTYLRFFAPLERLPEKDLQRFVHVDHHDRVALVLVDGDEIAAVGRFDRVGGGDAEVAFNVSDAAQGKGLGSVLLEHLAAAGRELGVRRFVADVLPENGRMLRVFADAGYDMQQSLEDGVIAVAFTIRPTDRSLAVLAERERRAEALSMAGLLTPSSVVLYCAGEHAEAFASRLDRALAAGDFAGQVHRVGLPGGLETLDDVPGGVELALVVADGAETVDLVPRLAELGVHGLVVYTGGFTTATGDGRVPQHSLIRAVRRHGVRLVGPRSFGLVTGGAGGHLNATLWPEPLRDGVVGLFCQSAAAGLAMLSGAAERDLGVSSFLSAGHRADVSGNDTMQFWVADERTRVACLRLETIGNPRKFSRVARHLSEQGPVVAMIAGTSGQMTPPGHAVRPTREPRRALDELMRQAGVLHVDTIPAMLDVAALLSEQPLPAGDDVVVVTNTGSQGAVIAELLRARGMTARLRVLDPTARAGDYAETVDAVLAGEDFDAALVSYVPLLHDDAAEVAGEAARLAVASGRTTLACIHGLRGLAGPLDGGATRVPGFDTVEGGVAALALARQYHRWRHTDLGSRVDPDGIDRRRAKELVQSELAGLPRGTTARLSADRTAELLAAYGVRLWGETRVADADEAVEAAHAIGWPVALKSSDEVLRHRTDLGGVRLDLGSPEELREAYAGMDARVRAIVGHGTTFDVQAMAPPGAACLVRAVEDELYGPIVNVGLAGDAVELLGDVSYRVPPLTDGDVREMVRSLRAAPRLFGYRGLPALDVSSLEEVIARISVLKEELAEVTSVQLNPVLVSESGSAVLGAHVDVAHPARGDVARRVLP